MDYDSREDDETPTTTTTTIMTTITRRYAVHEWRSHNCVGTDNRILRSRPQFLQFFTDLPTRFDANNNFYFPTGGTHGFRFRWMTSGWEGGCSPSKTFIHILANYSYDVSYNAITTTTPPHSPKGWKVWNENWRVRMRLLHVTRPLSICSFS